MPISCGEFDRCIAIVDRELDSGSYRAFTEHYAAAYLLKAHALVTGVNN